MSDSRIEIFYEDNNGWCYELYMYDDIIETCSGKDFPSRDEALEAAEWARMEREGWLL